MTAGVIRSCLLYTSESLNGKTVEKLSNTFIARTMIHAERRSAEMRDVVATLEALGVDDSMSKATVAKLDALAEEHWAEKMDPSGNMDYKDAIRLWVNKES